MKRIFILLALTTSVVALDAPAPSDVGGAGKTTLTDQQVLEKAIAYWEETKQQYLKQAAENLSRYRTATTFQDQKIFADRYNTCMSFIPGCEKEKAKAQQALDQYLLRNGKEKKP
jgi:hypothetical protein